MTRNKTVKPKMNAEYGLALIRHFQEQHPALEADGILGPKTKHALDEYIAEIEERDPMQLVWLSAHNDLGKGGHGGNNAGPYIRSLRKACGFPEEMTGAWCAIFQSAHLLTADIPIKSRGAYRLCEKMANHPRGFERKYAMNTVVGNVYLACWKRRRWTTHREAHVRLVKRTEYGFDYIGGNEAGDVVATGYMTIESFRRDLIMIAGWSAP